MYGCTKQKYETKNLKIKKSLQLIIIIVIIIIIIIIIVVVVVVMVVVKEQEENRISKVSTQSVKKSKHLFHRNNIWRKFKKQLKIPTWVLELNSVRSASPYSPSSSSSSQLFSLSFYYNYDWPISTTTTPAVWIGIRSFNEGKEMNFKWLIAGR